MTIITHARYVQYERKVEHRSVLEKINAYHISIGIIRRQAR